MSYRCQWATLEFQSGVGMQASWGSRAFVPGTQLEVGLLTLRKSKEDRASHRIDRETGFVGRGFLFTDEDRIRSKWSEFLRIGPLVRSLVATRETSELACECTVV